MTHRCDTCNPDAASALSHIEADSLPTLHLLASLPLTERRQPTERLTSITLARGAHAVLCGDNDALATLAALPRSLRVLSLDAADVPEFTSAQLALLGVFAPFPALTSLVVDGWRDDLMTASRNVCHCAGAAVYRASERCQ